ncbi:MAG: hypothetical protein PHQ77_09880 [Proteiniphilum sp.]|jgi:hypothetical protein|nr:hypothetical protein [Proteiniphilum sp.]
MRYLLLLILIFSFVHTGAQQQSQSRFRIGIEYGSYKMAGEINDQWEFRQVKTRYVTQEDQTGSEHVKGEGEVYYAGLKSELSVWENRLTLTSGIRYSRVNERISPSWDAPLYLFHPSDQGIELFRVRGMNESLGYVGVPLEADFLLWGRLSNWQGYVKAGIQAGMKIHGKTTIDFASKEMEKYGDEIITAAGKAPSNFLLNTYGGLGLRLILNNGIRLSIEALFPQHFLTKDNFSLLASESYGGAQLSVSLPVNLFSMK